MATNSWSKSLRKVCLRSQSKQRDRHVAFGFRRPLSLGRVGHEGSGASAGPSQCELHVDAWARGAPAAPAEGDAPKKKRGPGGPGGSGPGPNSGAGPIILSFCLSVSPQNLENIICVANCTGLSSDMLLNVRAFPIIYPATLSTFPHQLCLKGANKEKAGPNRRERRAAARGEVRGIDNLEKTNIESLEALGIRRVVAQMPQKAPGVQQPQRLWQSASPRKPGDLRTRQPSGNPGWLRGLKWVSQWFVCDWWFSKSHLWEMYVQKREKIILIGWTKSCITWDE